MVVYSKVAATLPKKETEKKLYELRIVGASKDQERTMLKQERANLHNRVSPFTSLVYRNAKLNNYGIYSFEPNLMDYVRVSNIKGYTLSYKEYESEYLVKLFNYSPLATFRCSKDDIMCQSKFLKFKKRIITEFSESTNLFTTDLPKLGCTMNLEDYETYFS